MAEANIKNHAAFIWSVADLPRGDYKQSSMARSSFPRRSSGSTSRRLSQRGVMVLSSTQSHSDAGERATTDDAPISDRDVHAQEGCARRSAL